MAAGLLDTSVATDWHDSSIADTLSEDFGISAITAAELTAGPLLATTPAEAARHQSRPQEVESLLELIPFDSRASRSYGLFVSAVVSAGRKPRSRFADLLIAATAPANGPDLDSRNPDDFQGSADLIRVVAV